MNKFVKKYIFFAMFWLLVVILSILCLPNITQLTTDKGQVKIPNKTQSMVAENIQKHWGHHISNTRQVVLVYGDGNNKISSSEQGKINSTVNDMKKHSDYYGIKRVTTPYENAATKKQMISKDGTTELVQLNVSKKDSVARMNKKLEKGAKTSGVASYVTGPDVLDDDFSQSLAQGIKKTELIATIFILIVLVIVFRSPIVPLISLLTVGVTFIVSLSVVMNLGKYTSFPISNFTQVFMVVVLFGIGTDYNILLYDRFRDNLAQGMDKVEATVDARRVAGKTILYSGCSLLIGFFALGLAKFSVYKSGVGVAVGVVILLMVLLTLNPFFMALLGKKMYWPAKELKEKKRSSKLWGFLSSKSVAHPVIAIGIVLILLLPFVFINRGHLNYDVAADLNNEIPAKQGLNVVQNKFSKGTAEPSTIYIKSKHPLNNQESLMLIDRVTTQLSKRHEIKTIASVTQPAGFPISQLYLNSQLGTLTGNMTKANKGLNKIRKGMSSQSPSFNPAPLESIGANAQQIGGHLQNIQAMSGNTQMPQGQSMNGSALMSGMQQKAMMYGQPMSPAQMQIVGGTLSGINSQVQSQQAMAQAAASAKMGQTAGELQGIGTNAQAIGNNAKEVGIELQRTQQKNQKKLAKANNGLGQISNGLNQANSYLTQLGVSPVAASTFFVPNQVMNSKLFKTAEYNYISQNNKATQIAIVLKQNPLNQHSMNFVGSVQRQVKNTLKGTSLNDATVAVGGETSKMADTRDIAQGDFARTAVIMLIGILLALMVATRSMVQPFYIEACLLLSYFASLSFTQLFSKLFLGQSMLTWNTPFFTFIMLIALGVDYSIFLMMKYRELDEGSPAQKMVGASKYIGVVVISAAIILGGTFASLIPSGILTLIQVATGVIIGLLILVIILPIILPAAVELTYMPINFNPFHKKQH